MTEDRLRHAVVLGGPQATGATTHERDRFLASQAGRPAWPPVLGDGLALLSLLGATLLFYRSFFSPNILASYDLLTYFYPYQTYAAQQLREGHLPLWNPYIFLGTPFLANIQAALFYPLSWPLLFLEAPQAVKASVVLHVFLSGLGMYLVARTTFRLSPWGALAAALPFMLGGYVSQRAGNPNQLQSIAWLPFLLIAVDRAVLRRSFEWLCAGGLVLALQLLGGHTQMVYLSLWTAGLLALVRVLAAPSAAGRQDTGRRWQRWATKFAQWLSGASRALFPLLAMGVIAAGLSAVQLVPTLELLSLSIRGGGLSFREAVSFSLPYWELLRALLPSFDQPPGPEFVAFVGLLPLALGVIGLRGAAHPLAGYCTVLALVALFFALGGYNPLAPWFYEVVPGLDQFRVPGRWLLLWTVAAALAAGIGMDALTRSRPDRPAPLRALLRASAEVLAVGGALVLAIRLLHAHVVVPEGLGRVWAIGLIGGVLVLRWVHLLAPGWPWGPLLTAAIALELFIAGGNFDRNYLVSPDAYSSLRTTTIQLLARLEPPPGARVLSMASSDYDPGDAQDLRQAFPYPTPRQFEAHLASAKYREILAPNFPMVYRVPSVDGYDGGLLPLQSYVDLRVLLVESGGTLNSDPRQRDAVLRYLLHGPPDADLLGALNVRYLLADKRRDLWVDHVYYDTLFTQRLTPGQQLVLPAPAELEATHLGIVSFLGPTTSVAPGIVVAELTVAGDQGQRITFALRAGSETGTSAVELPGLRHVRTSVASPWIAQNDAVHHIARLPLGAPMRVRHVELVMLLPRGELFLRGLSLFDQRTGAAAPVPLDPRFKPIIDGDVKVYELSTTRPRASLLHQYEVVSDPQEAMHRLAARPQSPVLPIAWPPRWSEAADATLPPNERLELVQWTPERVLFQASLRERGFLLWRESYYPGWRALVDGVPTEVVPAYGVFQAVPLPPGEHTVELAYDPASLRLGAIVSLGSIALLALVLLVRLMLPRGR